MHRNVEALLGRLVTNPAVRRRFAADPMSVLREFQEEGYELTAIEFDALAATDPIAIRVFAESIDCRIRQADTVGRPPAPDSSRRGSDRSRD
jgi:hypothetical protein